MSKVGVKVTLETDIPRYWVAVDDQDVLEPALKSRTIHLDIGEHFLGWWFAGDPGSPYKITLAPATGFRIVAIGKHPIERKIAADRFQSADTMRFFVVPAKEA